MVPAFPLRHRHRAPQYIRRKMHVSVSKHDPLAATLLKSLLHRIRLAQPASRQGIDSYILQPKILLGCSPQNFRCAVLGTVVSRDRFIPRIIQSEKCRQRRRKFLLLVASCKKNRYRWAIYIFKRCDISNGRKFSSAKRHINRVENPEESGGERKGQHEPVQRPISSTA